MLDAMIADAKRCNAAARAAGWYPYAFGISHTQKPKTDRKPRSFAPIASAKRLDVLVFIAAQDKGASCSELSRHIGISVASAGKRLRVLIRMGAVKSEENNFRFGRNCAHALYYVTEKGRQAIDNGGKL